MRRLRLLLAVAVTGSIVAGGAGSAVQAAKAGGTCARKSIGGGWAASLPHFPAGEPQKVVQAVAVPYVPGRAFATNGTAVMRTDDLGCTWRAIALPASPGQSILPIDVPQPLDGLLRIPSNLTITDIAAPSSATQSANVYIGGTLVSPLKHQPVVYAVSQDGSVLERSSGLPSSGDLQDVSAVDFAPNDVYAIVTGGQPVSGGPGIYTSGNFGGTWQQGTAPIDGLTHLRADPGVPTTAYALGPHGLEVTYKGGQSEFIQHGPVAGDVASYDVVSGGGGARIVLGHTRSAHIDRSDDAGSSWVSEPTPVDAAEVALTPLLDTVAVADSHRLFVEKDGDKASAEDVTPPNGVPTDLEFTAPSPAGYVLQGAIGNAVVFRGFTVDGAVLDVQHLQQVVLNQQGPPKQFPATLTPHTANITLRPGAHRDVPYRLLLPRTPSPVDVMFLVDTTDSMQATIDGLRQDLAIIVNDVADTGLDARFGVAEFRDYAPNVEDMGAGEIGDKPYTLRRKIGLDDATLQAALNKLKAGGGGDPPEADLTALLQSTTGQGQIAGKKVVVPVGQDAGYRTGSLRLAVLATDAPFHRERHYLTPQWDTVVSTLRSHRVYPIGLAVQQSGGDASQRPQFESMHDEQDMATATGSLAPRGGVDCNGDLVPDVPAGQPFVCKVPIVKTTTSIGGVTLHEQTQPVKLAPAIVNAAENLPDLRTIGLVFNGDARVASLVTRAPVLNLRNDNTTGYTVRFTCPRAKQRHVYHLGINATDGTRSLVGSTATVTCDALAPLPHTKPLPPVAAVVPPAAVAAAPPAPGNPLPNANPNPNPVPNANAGFASQEEEQRQLAFADADAGVSLEESGEMQMSRLGGDGSDPAPWLFGGAAVLLTAATAYAARTRLSAAWHQNYR
ncbi:MAG TPA: hypothetical protein VFH66_06065 [Mycobacteriales bacterium]|nr:hypothetical protein [Mycobacteriales bacterium]